MKKIPAWLWIVGGGSVFLGAFAYFAAEKAGKTVKAAANAVNPLNPNNVFATGVNDVGQAITKDAGWSLGGWFYDVTHPAYDPNAPTVAEGTGGKSQQSQPASNGFTNSDDGLNTTAAGGNK